VLGRLGADARSPAPRRGAQPCACLGSIEHCGCGCQGICTRCAAARCAARSARCRWRARAHGALAQSRHIQGSTLHGAGLRRSVAASVRSAGWYCRGCRRQPAARLGGSTPTRRSFGPIGPHLAVLAAVPSLRAEGHAAQRHEHQHASRASHLVASAEQTDRGQGGEAAARRLSRAGSAGRAPPCSGALRASSKAFFKAVHGRARRPRRARLVLTTYRPLSGHATGGDRVTEYNGLNGNLNVLGRHRRARAAGKTPAIRCSHRPLSGPSAPRWQPYCVLQLHMGAYKGPSRLAGSSRRPPTQGQGRCRCRCGDRTRQRGSTMVSPFRPWFSGVHRPTAWKKGWHVVRSPGMQIALGALALPTRRTSRRAAGRTRMSARAGRSRDAARRPAWSRRPACRARLGALASITGLPAGARTHAHRFLCCSCPERHGRGRIQ
jgi:hypothetical protein